MYLHVRLYNLKKIVSLFSTQLYTSIVSLLLPDTLRIKSPTTIMIFEHWGNTCQTFVFEFLCVCVVS